MRTARGGPLRLMIYDRTCRGRAFLPGLSCAWRAGGRLYGLLGRFDAWRGVATWEEGLDWLAGFGAPAPIREIQFWGHGRWGCAKIAGVPLDTRALVVGHPHHPRLRAIRERLVPGEGLWWFRTCETFGRAEGQAFARAWTRFFRCRAAGHTYVIGVLQSGLCSLGPDDEPGWPVDEGLPAGAADAPPATALRSSLRAPHTISCFRGRIPAGF